MMRYVVAVLCLAPTAVLASQFSTPITVSELDNGVHLQTATARALAVSNDAVALVWEDNHSGKPAVYFAVKTFTQENFSPARKLSADTAAFEPTIASDGNNFVVMWESATHVYGSVCSQQSCAAAKQLSISPARQVSLTQASKGQVYLTWASKLKNVYQLQAGEVTITKNTLEIHNLLNVTATPKQPQSYPSLSVLPQGWTIAFEDREQGHTRLMTTFRPTGKQFLPPQLLNDLPATSTSRFGAGTGAMRAQLTDDGKTQVVAVWLDKRDFEGGYDVYAAMSNDAGKTFGADEKVQDPLGDNQPQWHANIAMSKTGKLFSAWSDPRDGTLDIWYSTRGTDGWSEDEPIPKTNETGDQTHPALAFDARETLHIAFVDTQVANGKKISRILYLTASP